MPFEFSKISSFIIPISILLGWVLAGLIFQKIIFSRIIKRAHKTDWKWDNIVIVPLKGITLLWFLLAGIYLALPSIPLSPYLSNMFQKTLLIVVIFSVTWVLSKISVGVVKTYTEKTEGALISTSIFTNLSRVLIFIVGGLIILQTLGISITPIITALGVGGIAIALALQDTLSSLFSGFYILISRQVKAGDYIKLDTGDEGYVVDINWRNTTLRPFSNNIIIVPNSKLASAITTNYNLPEKEVAVRVQVGVSYDSDLEHVEKVTIEVAKEAMKAIVGDELSFEPLIRYHTFADFSINFTVIMRGRDLLDQYTITHELVKRLHDRYKKEGIEIPFPIRTVHIKETKP
ncbi:MAG: mechanosensitive ion channel family protein [Desulfobacterales bacterium]|nr:mechanosensitive ion channel family protein [Desulfobacterales bacterium]